MSKRFNILLADGTPLYHAGIKLALKGRRHQIQFSAVSSFDALMKYLHNKPELDRLCRKLCMTEG